MEELTRYYREFHPAMAYRQITPTSTAPSGHLLDSCLVQERSVHRGENEAKRGKTRARHGQRKHSETKERQISICSNVSTEEVLLPVEDKPKLMNWSTVWMCEIPFAQFLMNAFSFSLAGQEIEQTGKTIAIQIGSSS